MRLLIWARCVALCALSLCSMRSVEIAIIGGGAAGVAAARRLHDAGRGCLLIEARDRLGGRAWTVSADGHPVEVTDSTFEQLISSAGERPVLIDCWAAAGVASVAARTPRAEVVNRMRMLKTPCSPSVRPRRDARAGVPPRPWPRLQTLNF